MISNAARARTDDFRPEIPCRPIAFTSPSFVIMSETSMMWRMSTVSPCSCRVLYASFTIAFRAASMPRTS